MQQFFFHLNFLDFIEKADFIYHSFHITESYVCILWIFVVIYLFPTNFSISFRICSTSNLSKDVTLSPFT